MKGKKSEEKYDMKSFFMQTKQSHKEGTVNGWSFSWDHPWQTTTPLTWSCVSSGVIVVDPLEFFQIDLCLALDSHLLQGFIAGKQTDDEHLLSKHSDFNQAAFPTSNSDSKHWRDGAKNRSIHSRLQSATFILNNWQYLLFISLIYGSGRQDPTHKATATKLSWADFQTSQGIYS